jgi:hypothetical protein
VQSNAEQRQKAASNSLDLRPRPAEVQQQAEPQSRRLQIVEALRGMWVIQSLHRFQCDGKYPLYQQLDIVNPDDHPIICNSDSILLHDVQPTFAQLMHQRVLQNPFQKPNAKRVQNLKGTANKPLGEPINPALISVHPWLKYLALPHASQPLLPQGHCATH